MAAIAVTHGNILGGAVTTLTVATVSLGPTVGGLRYRKEAAHSDIAVDQLQAVVKKILNLTHFFVATVLGEGTLTNLHYAWGQPATDLSGTTNLDITANELGEHELEFVGEAISSGTRTVTLTRAIILGASESAYTNEGGVVIPVEWECLWDTDNSSYGTIIDT